MILKQLILPPESYFTNCFTLRWEMTKMKYYHKVTEDVDRRTRPWDTVYLFDVIKVHLAKRNITGPISNMEMFLTSKANSFGAIIYQWFDGLVQPVNLERGNYYNIQIMQAREYQYLPPDMQWDIILWMCGSKFRIEQKMFPEWEHLLSLQSTIRYFYMQIWSCWVLERNQGICISEMHDQKPLSCAWIWHQKR